MQQLDRDTVSIVVPAPPEEVYDLVADVTRTPDRSPEIVACRWLDGATGPAVGARFEAVNQAPSGFRFRNRPRVTVADRGREFAFARTEPFGGTLSWRYRFDPEGTGTRVTESYEVQRPVSRLGWFVIERLGRGTDRKAQLRAGMRTTLERLRAEVADAAAAEAAPQ